MATYAQRSLYHRHPVARKLFEIAETKKSNLIISADLTNTSDLLKCADDLGPYIAVFKTHIDIVADFSEITVQGLKALAAKHNFLIFEDRKLVDIGNTVKKQYHGGALRLSEWADIVNLSILGGDGIIEALNQTITEEAFPYPGERALLILAEMTSKGSLATENYTEKCKTLVSQYPESVIGFVATKSLTPPAVGEFDFLVFTTGINMMESGDHLGQQYQTPADAVRGGSDFVIAGRGIYGAEDRVKAAESFHHLLSLEDSFGRV
ncbi:Orotidine 5'-phosphate decarboxylase [Colletotrichum orbiculare MAFF 240422]|uniref:Orotidine 5'-phosphate decarboxylase n=1 Tax=Colletotrichum orbiculare (strain 104-T / ATCC 96160 / CBS 514.97 / LARS 414 / MAFF 240422) TaxID=1213857 RepID=N4VV75_COLOR|nr:Orotidine 5'-phosphate decarboxylase [Colletotrichum orbiculare MAFF 240422]